MSFSRLVKRMKHFIVVVVENSLFLYIIAIVMSIISYSKNRLWYLTLMVIDGHICR